MEPWVANDQVQRLALLVEDKQRKQIEAAVEAEIQAAFAFAEESSFPGAHELLTDVFKET